MSISKKMVVGLTVAAFSLTSVGALAQDRYGSG
jgi:hypothetical protein